MDILRELTTEELDYIIGRLNKNLPYALKNLNYIFSAQIFKNVSIKMNKKFTDKVVPTFYVPRNGLKENCTIFGITGTGDHTVWYFTFEESLREIRECINTTKLINWNSELLFVTLHVEQIKPVLDFVNTNGIEITSNDYCSYYYLPMEDALNFDLE